jgi:hypothetical protein
MKYFVYSLRTVPPSMFGGCRAGGARKKDTPRSEITLCHLESEPGNLLSSILLCDAHGACPPNPARPAAKTAEQMVFM